MSNSAVRAIAVAFLALLALGAPGCTTAIEIEHGGRAAFDRYCSWDWVADGGLSIEGPGPDLVGLDRDLARWVERELARRGFDRVPGRPDLRIGVLLQVQREVRTGYQTGPTEHVNSFHDTPSYQVQRSVKTSRVYDHMQLGVIALDSRHHGVVWKGTARDRFLGRFTPHIEDALVDLLERFPRAGQRTTPEGACNSSA